MMSLKRRLRTSRLSVQMLILKALSKRIPILVEEVNASGFGNTKMKLTARGQEIIDRHSNPATSISGRLEALSSQKTVPVGALEVLLSDICHDSFWMWLESERNLWIAKRCQRRIAMPPGRILGWIGRTFFTSKTLTRVIEPLIADYQHEVFDAIVKGNFFREHYVAVVYSFKFLKVTIGKGVGAIMRFLLRLAVP